MSNAQVNYNQNENENEINETTRDFNLNIKLIGCVKITTVFSHAQTVVLCVGCNMVLCQPTGGLARVTTGNLFFVSGFLSIWFK